MASHTVLIKNISAETSEKEIKEFFSFCGKITELKVTPGEGSSKDASVTFEKETAAKTAQLLNNTQLGPSQISVTPADGKADDGAPHTSNVDRDTDDITQEEKPRSRILAEYLAHGYVVGDAALKRAIDLDQKHGVTNRFVNTLTNLDQKYHATDRAKATDQSYGITNRANSLFSGISSYFEKATSSPTGQKLVKFYTDGSRQVQDIHAEARRLANLKTEEHGGSAYKASGLEKVFGKEKAAAATGSDGTAEKPSESTESKVQIASPTVQEKFTEILNSSGNNMKDSRSARATAVRDSSESMMTCNCNGDGNKCTCSANTCGCNSCHKNTGLFACTA